MFICRENYLFICDCEKCKSQSTDPDLTSDDDDVSSAEDDVIDDVMTEDTGDDSMG